MAEIQLPPGVKASDVNKILAQHAKKQKKQKAGGKAKREAVSNLIKAHEAEYDTLLEKAKAKYGVTD